MLNLEDFIQSNPDPRELKRALAVKMSLEGYTHRQIIPILKVCSGFISKWKQKFEYLGVEGLLLGYQGSQSYLSDKQKREVIDWLQEKNYWNLGELEYYLADKYGLFYQSKQSYYDLFQEAGISWKKSQKKSPQRPRASVSKKAGNQILFREVETRDRYKTDVIVYCRCFSRGSFPQK